MLMCTNIIDDVFVPRYFLLFSPIHYGAAIVLTSFHRPYYEIVSTARRADRLYEGNNVQSRKRRENYR